MRRVVLGLAALLAAVAGCSGGSSSGYAIHDEVGATDGIRSELREDLGTLADAGWHLYLYLLPATAPVEDPARLGMEIERPSEDAGQTLVLLAAMSDPPQVVVRGPGGDAPMGRAAEVAAMVEPVVADLAGLPGGVFGVADGFVYAVGEAVDVDTGFGEPSEEPKDGWYLTVASFLAIFTVISVPLTVVRLLWRYRHDVGKVTTVGELRAGSAGLVEGWITSDQPFRDGSLFLRGTKQMMDKQYTTEQTSENRGLVTEITTWDVVREKGWKNRRFQTEKAIGCLSRLDDGTGVIWVSGDGARVDGEYLGATEREGDFRELVHGIVNGSQVSVQGMVHEREDGSLQIGGGSRALRKGFFVSVRPALAIARRGKAAAKRRAIVGAVVLVVCIGTLMLFG